MSTRKPQLPRNESSASRMVRSILLWMGIFLSIVLMYTFLRSGQRPEWNVRYSDYLTFLDENLIASATITKSNLNDYEFHGELKSPVSMMVEGRMRQVKYFVTRLGVIDSRTEELWRSKGITWTYEQSDSSWLGTALTILMWVGLFAIFLVMMRRMQAGNSARTIFSFGKARTRTLNEMTKRITFMDVAGAEEAKFELQEIVEFLREPQKFQRLGGKIPKGVLLLGPPGTGKTLLARAVAGEANVPFFSISGADFVEMFVGVGASRVRDLFDQAKRNAPCIVFIDEIDAVGRQRGAGLGGGHDEREQTLNALLVEMDGFEQNSGVIVIAATNRADILDPALLRPGRFDRHIVVDRPDVRGREGILKVHTRNIPLAPDVDLGVLARSTPGASGADLANIVNEAALFAARRGSDFVTMEDFEKAKDKVFMGIERRSLVLSEREKRITAYHEMGHALLGKLLPNADPVHKVTIIPRGPALGVTSYLPTEDRYTLSKEFIETQIMCLLGGRVAEKIVFNQYTTGAANDLERATMLARRMVTEWGMSERIGPVNYNSPHNEVFLGRDFGHVRPYSEQTAQLIDAEVTRIVRELEHRAEELLRQNEALMHELVRHLLEKETLDGAELDRLMEDFTMHTNEESVPSSADHRAESSTSEPTPSQQ